MDNIIKELSGEHSPALMTSTLRKRLRNLEETDVPTVKTR